MTQTSRDLIRQYQHNSHQRVVNHAPKRARITTFLFQTPTMPPIRNKKVSKSPNREGKVILALNSFQNDQLPNLHAAAKIYGAPYFTVGRSAAGTASRADTAANNHKLTQEEEDSLTQWILDMDSRRAAPRPATVREIANILLEDRGASPPSTVGIH